MHSVTRVPSSARASFPQRHRPASAQCSILFAIIGSYQGEIASPARTPYFTRTPTGKLKTRSACPSPARTPWPGPRHRAAPPLRAPLRPAAPPAAAAGLPRRHPELPLDQIPARHLLRHRMLHLQPRVHFQELEVPPAPSHQRTPPFPHSCIRPPGPPPAPPPPSPRASPLPAPVTAPPRSPSGAAAESNTPARPNESIGPDYRQKSGSQCGAEALTYFSPDRVTRTPLRLARRPASAPPTPSPGPPAACPCRRRPPPL